MSKKAKRDEKHQAEQMSLDFNTVISSSQILSRGQVEALNPALDGKQSYDPIAQTTDYMRRVVQVEEAWETTLQRARQELLTLDARELYFEFLCDLKRQIEEGGPRVAGLASLLESVAVRGLGMTRDQIAIQRPLHGAMRWQIAIEEDSVREHLDTHIIGDHFLNVLKPNTPSWRTGEPIIGASDVSQHRSAVPVPARYFKRSVPFVLNNAAGTVYANYDGRWRHNPIFNPKPSDELLRWMLIDPSYQDELESEDYERCIASAMDVGQYRFDLDYLMKSDRRPDVIFRDGSLFPQDAYLSNYILESKRGEFTREAIREFLDCLLYASGSEVIYCGVAKSVLLKVYAAITDWYIERHIDENWGAGNYTLNDGQAMSLLLASPTFVGSELQQVVSTCLVRRSFTTRATLNTRTDLKQLQTYFDAFQQSHPEIDITPYRQLCEVAHVFMFFMGHSKSPQQQLPRYEFFARAMTGQATDVAMQLLAALRHCGLMDDHDHSFMADQPVAYLLPSVTQQAHQVSKDVGKHIDSATGQWIMSRYRSMLGN